MKNILILLLIPLLSGCGSVLVEKSGAKKSGFSKATNYAQWYEEMPTSILVMPPINETNNVPAKEYLYASLTKPLIDKGYYVFSPLMTMDFLEEEGAYDSELFLTGDLSKFREVTDADAILFTTISNWQKGYNVIDVAVDYQIRSLRTGEVLLSRSVSSRLNFKESEEAGFLANLIVNSVASVSTPIVKIARLSIADAFSDIPLGKYHPKFGLDNDWDTFGNSITKTYE